MYFCLVIYVFIGKLVLFYFKCVVLCKIIMLIKVVKIIRIERFVIKIYEIFNYVMCFKIMFL